MYVCGGVYVYYMRVCAYGYQYINDNVITVLNFFHFFIFY